MFRRAMLCFTCILNTANLNAGKWVIAKIGRVKSAMDFYLRKQFHTKSFPCFSLKCHAFIFAWTVLMLILFLSPSQRRQEWWTAWTDERRKGMQLEEKQGALRRELDALHQRIIGLIMKRQPLVTGVRDEPSRRVRRHTHLTIDATHGRI